MGSAHAVTSDFGRFGYHLHGSTGQLLLIGVVVGAVGMLGLNMLFAGSAADLAAGCRVGANSKHSRRQSDSLQAERDTFARQLERERVTRARDGTRPRSPGQAGRAAPTQAARPGRDY